MEETIVKYFHILGIEKVLFDIYERLYVINYISNKSEYLIT